MADLLLAALVGVLCVLVGKGIIVWWMEGK